jgi:tetratricopeptide (TPR) repeat protein
MRFIILAAVWILARQGGLIAAETWYLEQGRDWKTISAENKFLLAVARTKKLVDEGQSKAAEKALSQLKEDFPEITGPDLDAFIEAEMLRCKGKFVKAARRYEKFLVEYYHQSRLYDVVLDRQFEIATSFLAGRKIAVLGLFKMKGYATGRKIMERIADRVGLDTLMGIRAIVTIAQSCERRGRFDDAYHKWWEIFSQHKTGQIHRDALLGMARCKHAAFVGPKYDASCLVGRAVSEEAPYDGAKGCYEEFAAKYPEDAQRLGIDEKLRLIDEQLAEKQLVTGQYYDQTGNRQSANFYYGMVVDNWPTTKAAQTAGRILAGSLDDKETNK